MLQVTVRRQIHDYIAVGNLGMDLGPTLLFLIEFCTERNGTFRQPVEEHFQKGDEPGFCRVILRRPRTEATSLTRPHQGRQDLP